MGARVMGTEIEARVAKTVGAVFGPWHEHEINKQAGEHERENKFRPQAGLTQYWKDVAVVRGALHRSISAGIGGSSRRGPAQACSRCETVCPAQACSRCETV